MQTTGAQEGDAVTDRIDLDELERLHKAATPGPWRMQTRHDHLDPVSNLMLVPVVRAPWPDLPHGSITVARCGNGNAGTYSSRPTPIREREQGNAAFIAAARNALPGLIAELREARELLERAEPYLYNSPFENSLVVHNAIRAHLAKHTAKEADRE